MLILDRSDSSLSFPVDYQKTDNVRSDRTESLSGSELRDVSCSVSNVSEVETFDSHCLSTWLEKMGERLGRHQTVHDVSLHVFSSHKNRQDVAIPNPLDEKKIALLAVELEAMLVGDNSELKIEEQARQRAVESLAIGSFSRDDIPLTEDGKDYALYDHAGLREEEKKRITEDNFGNKWDRLVAMIDASEQNNVEGHASALEQYTRLYQGVSNVLSKLGTLVATSGDNKMSVDFPKVKEMLTDLLHKYLPPTDGNTIAGTVRDGLSKDQAEQICKDLKLPDKCVTKNSDFTYCVIPDLTQIEVMINSLPEKNNLSIAHYNAWKSGFDAQMNRIEEVLQDRGHKYSYTFGRFENFYKTISFILQSMTDMLKMYPNAMRGG